MKKSITLTLIGVICAGLLCGCATAPKGPSDKDLVSRAVADWSAAVVAQDLDKIMACYSEKFEDAEYGNKDGYRKFVKDVIGMGHLKDAKFASPLPAPVIERGQATVEPIALKAAFGSATIKLILKKEGNAWLITGSSVQTD